MLDTPGVLTPRIDGGWEAALRLGALDLLKFGHDSLEAVGAYTLHHFATTTPDVLERWPRVRALAPERAAPLGTVPPTTAPRADPYGDIYGSGPDPLLEIASTGGDRGARARQALADDDAACGEERFGLQLLDAAAVDMKLFQPGSKLSGGEQLPNRNVAASRILAMLRKGGFGPVCFDMYPPLLEVRRRQERGLPAYGSLGDAGGRRQANRDRRAKLRGRLQV